MEVLSIDALTSPLLTYNDYTCRSAIVTVPQNDGLCPSASNYYGNVIYMDQRYNTTEKKDIAIRIIEDLWTDKNVLRISGLLIDERFEFFAQLRNYTNDSRLGFRKRFLDMKENTPIDNSILYCFAKDDEFPQESYFLNKSRC